MNSSSWPEGLAPSGSLESNHYKDHSFLAELFGAHRVLACGRRMGVKGWKEPPKQSPDSVDLIDQVEDHGNTLVIDTKVVLQITNELRSGKVTLRKAPLAQI